MTTIVTIITSKKYSLYYYHFFVLLIITTIFLTQIQSMTLSRNSQITMNVCLIINEAKKKTKQTRKRKKKKMTISHFEIIVPHSATSADVYFARIYFK